jgi:ATP-dependent DNA helicase PIF1
MDFKLSIEQQYALQKFKRGENLFITGPGGTGKTKLIQTLVEHAKSVSKPIQVCALTGCASILLGCDSRTLHSWSGIRLAKGDRARIIASVLKNRTAKKNWKTVRVLIIDEVSMMSLKVFELIEEIARSARLSVLPFGGIQVILTGDFYQLPPVGSPGEPETEMFCFESPVWPRVFPRENMIELKTIFRQTDPKYKEILLQIRTGNLTEENAKLLQGMVKRPFDATKYNGCVPTKLFPIRAKTDFLNKLMFDKLTTPEFTFVYERKHSCKTYLESNKPISLEHIDIGSKLSSAEIDYEIQNLITGANFQEQLVLKIGAIVMCTVNLDMDNGICNGSQGIIIDIIDTNKVKTPVVKFTNGITRNIIPHFRQSDEYPTLAVGQIPLCLAWALTIHKIQGATLQMADIDVGTNVFEYGQTYVALSRVQSLDGLYLTAFNAGRIRVNERVRAFYSEIPSTDYSRLLDHQSVELDLEKFEYKSEPDPTIKKIRL